MTGEQLIIWILIIGCLTGVTIAAARRVASSGRRLRTPPTNGSVPQFPGQPQAHAGVELGPALPVEIDMHALFGGRPLRRGAPLIVPMRQDPLWVEKGWRRNGKGYFGHYRAAGQQWRGVIQQPYPGSYEAYIWNPPLEAIKRNTRHGPCFQPSGDDGRCKVLFHYTPNSLDHAITGIEEVLGAALGARS